MALPMNEGSSAPPRRRRAAVHFSMLVMLFVPLYRGLQWRTVVTITNATSNIPVDVNDKQKDAYIDETPSHATSGVHLLPSRRHARVTTPSNKEGTIIHANTTAFPNQTDDTSTLFLPENLAVPRRIPCGKAKCFFQLKTNRSLAFLVSRYEDRDDRQERFETLESGWKLATMLEQEYHIRHFLLAPPETIIISTKLESKMNTNLWSEKLEKMTYKTKNKKRFVRGSKAFIQKVQVAPSKPLLVGCAASKLEPFFKHVDAYKQAVRYPESYTQNIQQGFETSRQMLQKEPCLIKDFQIMLDTKGNVFHLDFDRCFMPNSGSEKYVISQEEIDSCLGVLNDVERQLLESIAKANDVSTANV